MTEAQRLVRRVRTATGMTQMELAGYLGVSFATVSRWENGHVHPSPLAMEALKSALRLRKPILPDPRKCSKCGAKTRTLNSRWHSHAAGLRRRRACNNPRCGERFTTVEVPAYLWDNLRSALWSMRLAKESVDRVNQFFVRAGVLNKEKASE